jgi:flagellar hook-associated protein 2
MSFSSLITSNVGTSGTVSADVYAKVNAIMQSQNKAAPILNAALTADTTALSGLGKLQSVLATFQGVTQSLSGNGLNLAATSSNTGVLSTTLSGHSVAGNYAIQVTQLAQGQVLQSKSLASSDAAIGLETASKLTFEFGKTSGNTFTPVASAKSLVLPNGTHSLQSIASTINGANIGVTAKVIASGTGYALELHSPTGAANSLRISVTGDAAMNTLLAYNPAGVKNSSQTAAAQDAALTINGVATNSPANTLANAVPGTSISLTATGSTNLVVVQGAAQITQNVTTLVNAYNTLTAQLNTLKQSDLKADGSALRAQNQLGSILLANTGGTSGSTSLALAKIGITMQPNGILTIDSAKLKNAISADPSSVTRIFTNGGKGIADTMSNQIQGLIGPVGSLPKKMTTLNQDVTALTAKKATLEKTLTAQAQALLNYYSQQNALGSSTETTNSSSNQLTGGNSIFNFLP